MSHASPTHASLADRLIDLPRQTLLVLVKGYRLLLKPSLGNACRFEPTCSQYALTALERHGAVVGASLSAWRVLRCHPWCDGGCDPVPQQAPGLFRRLGLGNATDGTTAAPRDENATPSPVAGRSTEPPNSPVCREPHP